MARTHSEPLTIQAAEIAAALEQIRRTLRTLVAEHARGLSVPLTPPQLLTIETLVDASRSSRGGLSLSELSRRLGLSHSTVSGIVDRLEARGFLRRVQRADDRRFIEIQLTDPIERWLAEELPGKRIDPIAAAIATVSRRDRTTMRDGVVRLAALLTQHANEPNVDSRRAGLS
jgi:DNA-binding MarR family transcriptional regulator